MSDERVSAFYGASSLGLTLLRAGRDELPSDDALARTLAAVGASTAVLAATAAATTTGISAGGAVKGSAVLVSFGSVMKWLGMGALGGVVVADRARSAGLLDGLDGLLAATGPADRHAARDEVVAAVAVLDLDDVAGGAEAVDLLHEDELHVAISRQRPVDV